MPATAKLALEDGSIYAGHAFGAEGEIAGEVVFNTSMTGYQEILTDPSYCGQIVTMTYPEIGNYGVNAIDVEHESPALSGFIVREESRVYSNYRANGDLGSYLKQHGVIALSGIDTRALVRRIRTVGAMRGVISTTDLNDESLIAKAKASPSMVGRDLVSEVVPDSVVGWDSRLDEWSEIEINQRRQGQAPAGKHIVCLDFGMKWNIPRHFVSRGNRVTIIPGNRGADEVLALEPDGIFLSNGPGDPEPLTYAHDTIRQLVGKKPIFGICLGHQLLALACGAKTFKLKFGHRGANQPVFDLTTGKVEITTQNHGFAVEEESLPDCLEITHRHLNDDTIAGIRHREHNAFGIQYHPEASSGPHDSHYLFDRFQQQLS
ncbi:glutamine-hydrolyzing carbamoyl-phosphate synthase small subunit [Stieleria varia]|uniref:Carbamoyl phosphate synthase small chain n=1 Tax=Stieleria varia TaxID=2528005 RepID=A0A5C6AQG4_9BACT|nr:glutamine-hydrolyzing carbamoyl-phosphate synthase small subunit [Stieleria varia]TWU02293.1 Carbamoyl-phosphate synthase small chain [Stieleria varia]